MAVAGGKSYHRRQIGYLLGKTVSENNVMDGCKVSEQAEQPGSWEEGRLPGEAA